MDRELSTRISHKKAQHSQGDLMDSFLEPFVPFVADSLTSGAFANWGCPTDRECAACKQLAVQRTYGSFRHSFIFEFHETKAARFASRAVLNELDLSGFESLCSEPLRECLFRFRERYVSNEQSVQSHLRSLHSEYVEASGSIERCPIKL